MATDQPAPTVLLIVDPNGWLHEVPRELFTKWCKLKGIARADRLLRAYRNTEKGGYHFSNETVDRRGQWQPLHKLVFLQKVDKRLTPIPTEPLLPVTNLAIPWLESAQKRQEHGDRLDGLKGGQLRDYLAGHLKTGSGSNKRVASHYKHWVKVELPESEARQHLPLHHLPEQLVRNAASPSPSSQAVHAAPETAPRSAAAASDEVRRRGTVVHLGFFATAEEAALCVARTPEGQASAQQAAAAPLTSEEARQQAQAEGLTLLKAGNKAGYFGVCINKPGQPKRYKAQVWRGGKKVSLGHFATAEEAALCVARTPEGRAAAKRAAASEGGQGTGRAMPPGAVLKEEGAVPPMPPGAFVKEEQVAPPMPPGAFVKEEGVVPPMPPDAIVKREHTVVVKEEERSDGRAKRRRSK